LFCANCWAQVSDSILAGSNISTAAAPSLVKQLANGPQTVDQAIERAMVVLEKAVVNYPQHRSCFSCHHQALPQLAFSIGPAAREHRLTAPILKFTQQAFENRHETLRAGGEIGGRALTVGYALWTLDLAGQTACETTAAMVEYLLKTQAEDGAWNFHSLRPPAASSRAMTTAIAVYGLRAFGPETVTAERLDEALQRAADWITAASSADDSAATLESHEDLIGRLWLANMLMPIVDQGLTDGEHEPLDPRRVSNWYNDLINELWLAQRSDGGWAQTKDMQSDAYATGQALALLAQATLWSPDSPNTIYQDSRYQLGINYLLRQQQADGSWLVVSRSKPVQVFFDNGDPHDKNQFISMMATSWATTALQSFAHQSFRPLESQQVIQRQVGAVGDTSRRGQPSDQ
jgi:N-acyl-D-amino-acid deacylase